MSYSEYDDVMLVPVNTITAVSLKDAAATSGGKFAFPKDWGTVYVLEIGATFDTAGGAQTTAGTFGVYIAGSAVNDSAGNPFTVASVASHAAWSQVETSLNGRDTDLTDASNNYNAEPNWPEADSGEALEVKVITQGVGAGDQTCHPYLIVRRKPS